MYCVRRFLTITCTWGSCRLSFSSFVLKANVAYMGDGKRNPYTSESAFCTARREESSAITGRISRHTEARAICVYIEKLGLQSKKIVSYAPSRGVRKSRIQSIIATHVFVPGICAFESVLIAFACSSRSGSPQTKSMFLGIKALNSEGVVIKSPGAK